jgi:hypothetical protein
VERLIVKDNRASMRLHALAAAKNVCGSTIIIVGSSVSEATRSWAPRLSRFGMVGQLFKAAEALSGEPPPQHIESVHERQQPTMNDTQRRTRHASRATTPFGSV